jgi:glycosyltransferase involved in cell wall biosynthesis
LFDFSVIIPAYQEEALIGRLLSQFPPEFRKDQRLEIIVSDGGSTDRTREIAFRAADTVVEHTSANRQTISGGRNCGADTARGALLVFLNADVTVDDPGQLISAARAAFSDPAVAAATCAVLIDPREATRFDRVFHTLFNAWIRGLLFLRVGMGRGECQIVRAELFRRTGGYNEALAAGEDFDLFRRLGRRGRIRFLPGVRVYESPRRYRALGYPRVLATWFANAVSVVFRGSSRSKEWDPVR